MPPYTPGGLAPGQEGNLASLVCSKAAKDWCMRRVGRGGRVRGGVPGCSSLALASCHLAAGEVVMVNPGGCSILLWCPWCEWCQSPQDSCVTRAWRSSQQWVVKGINFQARLIWVQQHGSSSHWLRVHYYLLKLSFLINKMGISIALTS